MAGRCSRRAAAPTFLLALWIITGAPLAASAQSNIDLSILSEQIARLYQDQKYTEAKPLAEGYVSLARERLGEDHPQFATAVCWLAELNRALGRYADANSLYQQTISILLRAVHRSQLSQLDPWLYQAKGAHIDAAVSLYEKDLAAIEKRFGPDDARIDTKLNLLAHVYQARGRFADAELAFKRALTIAEKDPGSGPAKLLTALSNLVRLYRNQGRYTDAEPLYERARAIAEKSLNANPEIVDSLVRNPILIMDTAQSVDDSVLLELRKEGDIWDSSLLEDESNSFWLRTLLKVRTRLAELDSDFDGEARETFKFAQSVQISQAANSLVKMSARFAKADGALASLVRERQDLDEQHKALFRRSIAPGGDLESRLTDLFRGDAIRSRVQEIDQKLETEFPTYASLVSPKPLDVGEVQRLLHDGEALIEFMDTSEWNPMPDETFIWVVTKTDSHWVRSELGTPALMQEVAALRCGLDYEGAWKDAHCSDLLKIAYTRADHDVFRKPLPFDLARAHSLYKGLFGRIEDLIRDKRLLIVPSGPLTQLPFQVLVTEPPRDALPNSAAEYRGVSWLARKHPIAVLPAVSSLKALRELAKDSQASEPYIGFGDPLLDGEPTKFPEDAARAKLAREKRCDPTLPQRVASLHGLRGGMRGALGSNGGIADVADIRTWAPLPETADELCDVARDLGIDPKTHLYLGAAATETKIKQLSKDGTLAKYRIIHFATHGAVAGQLSSASEPGLLLTPPDKASEVDDGYLSASEIAGLKLDADWVILSACNTASGDAKGAEALSGLARAFFYAGDRSLVVSHWEVASESTVKLITKAIDELKRNPEIGRAQALQRSMLSMMTTGRDYEAHPAFWAPFVLVGEGRAGR
jgi:CHAT domain-containing protein/tetratricopeptide (TPR) repeat protein